jgi:hypothetical protein
MSDSITKNFDQLGVPLINQNWSWGASNDAVVVLRAWQDHIKRLPDRTMLSLLWQDWWGKNSSGGVSLGGNERLRHLEEIKAGKPCFVVLMHDKWGGKKDPERSIIPSKNRAIFHAGDLLQDEDGTVWIELARRIKDISAARAEIREIEKLKG